MIRKKFTFDTAIKSVEKVNDTTLKITGYASTADTDRVGDVIIPDAWTKGGLDNFSSNPIILFNHDYSKPVGRATRMDVDAKGLLIEANISKSAGDVYGLIEDNVLSTFSVGFRIKDADYNSVTDGYIIKDAELLEVSVVSVPCNQAATFSVAKSFNNAEELAEFKKEILKGHENDSEEVNASDTVDESPNSGTEVPPETIKMDEEQMKALIAEATAKALADQRAAEETARAEAAAKAAEEEKAKTAVTIAAEAATKTLEEKLLQTVEEKLAAKDADMEKTVGELKTALEEKSEELRKMAESKRHFTDRGVSSGDWLSDKSNYQEAEDAWLLSKVLRRPMDQTVLGKSVLQKFNTHSTVTVGSDALETTVSTNIERDIWNDLILAPMFREIQMNSASMSFPTMPDAGYAEVTSATKASGSQPNGNMDQRGAGYGAPYQGFTLGNRQLSTVKMIAKAYLGNETEEDTIIPILPLIKEAMTRSHARGVENMLLAGNTDQGVYTSGAANGLIRFAQTSGRTVTAAAANTALTGAALFGMRKLMGKYGLNPRDIVYIVSQDAYFQLIEDPEFADADLVGANNANKLTGEVGRIYGSQVVLCDEFAPAGPGNYFALALNRRNFVLPRLRGMTVESQYSVEDQHTVLVSSQRFGFDEIIQGAPSVIGLKYGA